MAKLFLGICLEDIWKSSSIFYIAHIKLSAHTYIHTCVRLCLCVYWTRLTVCPVLDINCAVTLYYAAVSTASDRTEQLKHWRPKAKRTNQSWQADELSGTRFIQSFSQSLLGRGQRDWRAVSNEWPNGWNGPTTQFNSNDDDDNNTTKYTSKE